MMRIDFNYPNLCNFIIYNTDIRIIPLLQICNSRQHLGICNGCTGFFINADVLAVVGQAVNFAIVHAARAAGSVTAYILIIFMFRSRRTFAKRFLRLLWGSPLPPLVVLT